MTDHDEPAAPTAGPVLYECEQYAPVKIPLAEVLSENGELDLNPDIDGSDYFQVDLSKRKLVLRARGHIGLIPVNDRVVVRVRPRVPIGNLTRIVNLAGYPPTILTALRDYGTTPGWNDALLDVYSEQLLRHADGITQAGLMREYVRRESDSSFPRGRVLVGRTVLHHRTRGIRHVASTSWFERTMDVPVNQCLKYAIWLLARRYAQAGQLAKQSRRLLRRLNAASAVFDGAELDHARRFMNDPLVSGARPIPTLRAYYAEALAVARAIIEQRAVLIESSGSGVRLPSMVLNLNYVFEHYIRKILTLHAAGNGWTAQVLDGNKTPGKKLLFNQPPSEDATPDVVIRLADGPTALVIEVKNIPIKRNLSERDALNQAVTYAVSYRTKKALLVHPRKAMQTDAGLRLQGVADDIEIHQYCFDMAAADLEAEEIAFGDAVAALVAS